MSKIYLNSPSKKAILHSGKLSIEFIEVQVEKLRELFNKCGYDLHPEAADYERLKDMMLECVDSDELLSSLCKEDIGIGYLLGASMAVIHNEVMDEEEDDDDLI